MFIVQLIEKSDGQRHMFKGRLHTPSKKEGRAHWAFLTIMSQRWKHSIECGASHILPTRKSCANSLPKPNTLEYVVWPIWRVLSINTYIVLCNIILLFKIVQFNDEGCQVMLRGTWETWTWPEKQVSRWRNNFIIFEVAIKSCKSSFPKHQTFIAFKFYHIPTMRITT